MGPNTGGMGAITHPFCSYKKNDIYSLILKLRKFLLNLLFQSIVVLVIPVIIMDSYI